MNARYYVPNTNRWLSPDTIVPDPANPQSFNRYSYVENNPINRTDPTGHISCAELGTEECYSNGDYVDSPQPLPWDLTEVLVNEMVHHVHSPEMREIQEGMPFTLLAFRDLNTTNGLYDIKATILEKDEMIMLCSLEECGWFDYSTPGNIHYGYMAASAGIPIELSDLAAGWLETVTFFKEGTHSGSLRYLGENAEDAEAVRLGYLLYERYGDDLTVTEFQIGLTVFWDDLQRPNPDLVIPLLISPEEYVYHPGALENRGQ